MSNIYIQEPPTSGKVLMKTSAGDIDIELWTREAPKTCRNFIQLCLERYYDGTIFHRVIKGFIAQGGDPNGDGSGGESVYGEPFKDEFHSRLRFCRRGLVASANSGKDDNGSQFFFTLGDASELQNKHTIFGKVTGDTLFNMLKLEDGEIDANDRPLYPYKIVKTEVLLNPFDDIVPRQTIGKEKKSKSSKRSNEKGVKNFGLLSFGVEAEEDEEQIDSLVQKYSGKAKSLHDAVDDALLSREVVKITPEDDSRVDSSDALAVDAMTTEEKANRIRDKLKTKPDLKMVDGIEKKKSIEAKEVKYVDSGSDSDEYANELHREKKENRKKEAEAIRNEIQALKKEFKAGQSKKPDPEENNKKQENEVKESGNELIQSYLFEQRKYGSMKKDFAQKGEAREKFTLQLLSKFKSKLISARQEGPSKPNMAKSDEDDLKDESWLAHTLRFDETGEVLAKDASTKKDDWYDVYDPRNPLNKRKRGERTDSERDRNAKHNRK